MTLADAELDPQRDFAEVVVRTLRDAGFTALWAGGCVRDLLIGRTPKDYDVATDARPEQVRKIFGHQKTIAVGESFGVIIVLGPKRVAGQVEVATFRNDGQYVDGRRPESVEFSSPEEDARRRDFTINGMFYDPVEMRVLDYVEGEADLRRRVIRAIGTARHRMREDKLRLLRAVRFAATFEFAIEEETATAIREMAAEISVVSAERIAQELRRMLGHPNCRQALELCRNVDLLPQILPEIVPLLEDESSWDRLVRILDTLSEPTFPVAFAAILGAVADQAVLSEKDAGAIVVRAGKRLRLSNEEIQQTEWLVRNRLVLDDAPRLSLARLKRTLSEPLASELLDLLFSRHVADEKATDTAEFCRNVLSENSPDIMNPPPLITGEELIAAGLSPGPRFKQILETVRDAQLNLEIATVEEAMTLAAGLAESDGEYDR